LAWYSKENTKMLFSCTTPSRKPGVFYRNCTKLWTVIIVKKVEMLILQQSRALDDSVVTGIQQAIELQAERSAEFQALVSRVMLMHLSFLVLSWWYVLALQYHLLVSHFWPFRSQQMMLKRITQVAPSVVFWGRWWPKIHVVENWIPKKTGNKCVSAFEMKYCDFDELNAKHIKVSWNLPSAKCRELSCFANCAEWRVLPSVFWGTITVRKGMRMATNIKLDEELN